MADPQPHISEWTKKEGSTIKKVFEQFDKNGDGTISADELQSALALRGCAVTDNQIRRILGSVGKDQSGSIDLEDFEVLAQTSLHVRSTSAFSVKQIQKIKRIFDTYDKSGSGTLSEQEIAFAMRRLGQTPTELQVKEFMAAADVDSSGSVDFPEFLDMMSKSEMLKKASTHKIRRHGGLVDWFVNQNIQSAGIGDASEEYSSTEESDDDEGFCTSNVRVLAMTASLFALITGLQTVGALFVGSKVLLADCVSMGVDACTYLANIFVEWQKGTRCYTPSELIVCSVSLAILVYLTWDVMDEAYDTLQHLGTYAEDEEESPWMPYIVLFFATFGIIIDAFSLYYYFHSDKDESDKDESDEDESDEGHSTNMFTALLHVGADLLRSITTFVSSLLMFAGLDIEKVDSIAAVVVGVTILAGAVYGVWELLVEARQYFCGSAHKWQFSAGGKAAQKLMQQV